MVLQKILHKFKYVLLNKSKQIMSRYILYKIVGTSDEYQYTIQCINSNTIFSSKITEIVYDKNILYGLHPIQACFIGIEYSIFLKTISAISPKEKQALKSPLFSRYGTLELCYETRTGQVAFTNQITKEHFLMDPYDIATSENLIQEFDAPFAFYIGFLAGSKFDVLNKENRNNSKHPHLRLVHNR